MKKLARRIPRPVKTLFFLIGILVTGLLVYIFIGAPPLSEEHRYRRAERANLVGPAKILDIIDLAPVVDEHYNRMVIADDGDAVILYMWDAQYNLSEKLVYRQKQGALRYGLSRILTLFLKFAYPKIILEKPTAKTPVTSVFT